VVYLFLFVCCSVTFVQVLRYGQARGADSVSAIAVNYIIAVGASLVLYAQAGISPEPRLAHAAVITGVINGLLFFSHVPFVLISFRAAGVGITAAATRVGIVIPILIAWLAWREEMTPLRWLGLALLPPAMFLLRPTGEKKTRLTLKGDIALTGCLVVAGAIFSIHKYADVHFNPAQIELYKVALFTTAMLAAVAYTAWKQLRCGKMELAVGTVMGLANVGALLNVMRGLARVPAVVFYPVSGSLIICLNVLVSLVLWKETLKRRQIAGLALAVLIILLANG